MPYFSNSVKFLFLLAFLAASTSLFAQEKEQVCNYSFSVPRQGRMLVRQSDVVMIERSYSLPKSGKTRGNIRLNEKWFFSCKKNKQRTSKIESLITDLQKKKEKIDRYGEILLSRNELRAVMLGRLRTHNYRKIQTLEVYFATRDFEYHFYILPTVASQYRYRNLNIFNVSEAATEQWLVSIRSEMRSLLQSGQFVGEVKAAITEKQYQRRLSILIAVLIFIMILAFFVGTWIYYRKYRQG